MFAIGLAAAGSGWIQSRGGKTSHPLRVTRVVAADPAPVTADSILRSAATLKLTDGQISRLRKLRGDEASAEQPLLTAARADAKALEASAAATHTLTVPSTRRIYLRYGDITRALANTRARFAARALALLSARQRASVLQQQNA
ncbi:MAG TPA: hypothetical protein VFJ58_20695 [Armatimonadota bacterium]|nr:hypothetical protein [Armatimonadota bacterium]